jgi:hypothetical protein
VLHKRGSALVINSSNRIYVEYMNSLFARAKHVNEEDGNLNTRRMFSAFALLLFIATVVS